MLPHFDGERGTGRNAVANWNKVQIPDRVRERAATRVARSSVSGCWISGYSVASHGYAQIGWQENGGRWMVLAHRASWERSNGPVPPGMTLDHLCKEKRCVNPDHLRLLDNFENGRRTHGRDWGEGECANGHPNSFLEPDPHRKTKDGKPRLGLRCSECAKLYARRATWREWRPGEPYPDDLMLSSERESS